MCSDHGHVINSNRFDKSYRESADVYERDNVISSDIDKKNEQRNHPSNSKIKKQKNKIPMTSGDSILEKVHGLKLAKSVKKEKTKTKISF